MLKINDFEFTENYITRDTCFMFFKDEDTNSYVWSIDCLFEGEFEDEFVEPSICINPIETDKETLYDLAGEYFELSDPEEAEEREDLFGIYDDEPVEEYKIEIIEFKDNKVKIKCNGTVSIDEESYPFSMDTWLPVIQEVSDWEKFGL